MKRQLVNIEGRKYLEDRLESAGSLIKAVMVTHTVGDVFTYVSDTKACGSIWDFRASRGESLEASYLAMCHEDRGGYLCIEDGWAEPRDVSGETDPFVWALTGTVVRLTHWPGISQESSWKRFEALLSFNFHAVVIGSSAASSPLELKERMIRHASQLLNSHAKVLFVDAFDREGVVGGAL